MALMNSLDIPLGSLLPEFTLKTADNKVYESKSLQGPQGVLIVVTCNHCPYAIAIWPRLIALSKELQAMGIHTAAINPNIHPNYPDDSPEQMLVKIKSWGIEFPYLVDEKQSVAKMLQAQCTPDLYLFDAAGKLAYHGRLDDNWKSPELVKKRELFEAAQNLVSGKALSNVQHPSMGCSIKWL